MLLRQDQETCVDGSWYLRVSGGFFRETDDGVYGRSLRELWAKLSLDTIDSIRNRGLDFP